MIAAVVDPLRHGLKDSYPYVRKTAAISFALSSSSLVLLVTRPRADQSSSHHSVAKLYSSTAGRQTLERSSFISLLRDLLADSNPTVVANAVAALVEISERSDEIALRLNITVAGKLVAALGECSE